MGLSKWIVKNSKGFSYTKVEFLLNTYLAIEREGRRVGFNSTPKETTMTLYQKYIAFIEREGNLKATGFPFLQETDLELLMSSTLQVFIFKIRYYEAVGFRTAVRNDKMLDITFQLIKEIMKEKGIQISALVTLAPSLELDYLKRFVRMEGGLSYFFSLGV